MPPDRLRFAAMVAILAGVSPGEAALALGIVPEETFYRALAAELGLAFVRRPLVSALARFPHSLTAGFAPAAAGPGFVAAPPAREVGRLLAVRLRFGNHVVMTTPTALRAAVFAATGSRIADLAADDLPRRRSALSYRDGTTIPQTAFGALASASTSAGLVLAPGLVGAGAALGLGALFFGMVVLRFAAVRIDAPVRLPQAPRRLSDDRLPVYTVIVPLRGESRVLAGLIEALLAIDYPAAKLDIKLVIEADDRETAAALAAIALPPWMTVVTAPPGEPRTKPRALNVALPLARGAFTVVYDAEDVPDPDQLRRAVALFADQGPEVGCLQARLSIDNTDDSWLTRLFTIEYASLFDVLNPALAAMGLPIPLGGTSNHFRTSALRRVGGWDAWNVTEDADLGIRLARFAYRTADLPSTTLEEAPRSLGPWMRQRTRWMKGYLQTCVTHSRHPLRLRRDLGWIGLGAAVTTMVGTVTSALVYPVLMGLALISLGGRAPGWDGLGTAAFVGLGLGAMLAPAGLALRRRNLHRLWVFLPVLPFYYALVSVAAWRALLELIWSPFHWNKTDHGRARTSRSGAIRNDAATRGPLPPEAG